MWKSCLVIFLLTIIGFYVAESANMSFVPAILAGGIAKHFPFHPAGRVQKAMVEGNPAHGALPLLLGRGEPRTRRAAEGPGINPSNGGSNYTAAVEGSYNVSIVPGTARGEETTREPEAGPSSVSGEQLLGLVEELKLRGACVEEYRQGNVGEMTLQARNHLRMLDCLANAKDKLRVFYRDIWVEGDYGRFFDAANQSYQTIEKRWEMVEGMVNDVDKLKRDLALSKEELKRYHEVSSYYEDIRTTRSFEIFVARFSVVASELVCMRRANYIESRLKGPEVPDGVFKVEAESFLNSSRRKLLKILMLTDAMDHIVANGEHEVDWNKLRKDAEYASSGMGREIDEANAAINNYNLRNNLSFKKAMEKLKEEVKEECEKLKSKVPPEEWVGCDGLPLGRALWRYMALSRDYDSECKFCFGIIGGSRLRRLIYDELDWLKTNATSTDC
jgi:hypothetical protein